MHEAFFTVNLADEDHTLALGRRLGSRMVAGDFIALTGPLGAGKTTLARGLIRAFVGAPIDVPSPTFTLVQSYNRTVTDTSFVPLTQSGLDLFHFDLYRLKNSDEVWELGWEDIASGIALVEWPDRAREYLPNNRLDIHLSFDGEGRAAQFSAQHDNFWKERLDGV